MRPRDKLLLFLATALAAFGVYKAWPAPSLLFHWEVLYVIGLVLFVVAVGGTISIAGFYVLGRYLDRRKQKKAKEA